MRNYGSDFGDYDREYGPRRDRGNVDYGGGFAMGGWTGTGTGSRAGQGMGGAAGANYDRNFGFGSDAPRRYDQTFRGDERSFRGSERGVEGYDRTFRGYDRSYRGYDRGFGMSRYDRGYRDASTSRGHDPFPTRSSVSTNPMNARRGGYDQGLFGIRYDAEVKRYDRNFGDFRNSYLGPWF